MTDRWTSEQITAHATWLLRTHGESLESLTITETAADHGIDVSDWGGDEWDAYVEDAEKLVRSARDLTDWAISLGADGLVPDVHRIDIGWSDGPLQARLLIAFDKDMPDDEREQLAEDLRNAIAGTVPVR